MLDNKLSNATKELAFQMEEKEKRAAELIIANKELAFQMEEKEKRAAELIIANEELVFQNEEKEKRAAELIIANEELVFQNEEKEKRAAELIIANKELVFQNEEKEKRAAELIIANKELVFQNEEKEKRAEELIILVKELEAFNYISSHDLQEPLRQIQMFSSRINDVELQHLSNAGKTYFEKLNNAAKRMQNLINDLLAYSRSKTEARKFKIINLNQIINEVTGEFEEIISDKQATVEVAELGVANVIPFQFRQLMYNLIGNALKFSKPDTPPHIIIKSEKVKSNQVLGADHTTKTEYYHISITDNGIGFESQYKNRIFEVFQRLHDKQKIAGTGIGLAIVKNIVENHNGFITATGELNKGATFDIYVPIQKI